MKIFPTEFDGHSIRRVYDEDTETWWFSVVDVVQVLTDSNNARRYWSDLKRKLAQEAGSEQPYEKIVQLKLTSPDGKQRQTDCAEAATLLRIVQSIPSPKAEPIKLWLAKVGYERMQEMADPALSLDRGRHRVRRIARHSCRARIETIGPVATVATGTGSPGIHQEWSGVSVAQHKDMKGLSSHNLRDHVSEAGLIFSALAELSTRQIAESVQATGTNYLASAAKQVLKAPRKASRAAKR